MLTTICHHGQQFVTTDRQCGNRQQKRAGGIEPPSLAWKAKVLPLNYARRVAQAKPRLAQITWG